jgi:hypothetical protein
MHLENLALLTRDGLHALSPVYDLLCSRLVIPDDPMALTVAGKKDRWVLRHGGGWRSHGDPAACLRPPGSGLRLGARAGAAPRRARLPARGDAGDYAAPLRERIGSFGP